MKISNKILIGGFSFLVILVIAALISGKIMLNREIGNLMALHPVSIVRMVD
ncbi:MAG: hypothetical protein HQ557_20000 [Bacteroidetes bacterium]|nr:hypothetical protein [Bacteroidota bacterium]